MLIKFDADQVLVDRLKAFTGQGVGSKAFHKAAEDALRLHSDLKFARADLADAQRTIAALKQTLERARSAAALLLEATGQGDMLDAK